MLKRLALTLFLSFLVVVCFAQNKSKIMPMVQGAHSSKIEFYDVWNEKHLLLTTSKNEIILWNTQTGLQLRKILTPHTIKGAVLTRKGEEIAVLNYAQGKDASLRFYNAKDGALIDTLAYYAQHFSDVYWKNFDLLIRDKDGDKLVLKAFDEMFTVDAIKRAKANAFKVATYNTKLAFTNQGDLLMGYTDNGNNKIEVVNMEGKGVKEAKKFTEGIISLLVAKNSFFVLGKSGEITEFDADLLSINQIKSAVAYVRSECKLTISDDGKKLVVPLNDDHIIYDLEQKKWVNKKLNIYEPIISCTADASQIAVLSNAVSYIQPITGEKILENNAFVLGLEGIKITPKGDVISASGGYSRLLNLKNGGQLERKFEIKEWLTDSVALCFDKNTSYIYTNLQIRNVYTGEVLNQINKEEMKIEHASLSPDLKTIAFSHSLTYKLYLATGENFKSIKAINNPNGEMRYFGSSFSPNSQFLAVKGVQQIGVYDLKSNNWILGADKVDGYGFSYFAFTPDSKALLYSYFALNKTTDMSKMLTNEIRSFDIATGISTTMVKIESSSACGIAVSPKDNLYAIGYISGLVEVRNLSDNSIVYTKDLHSAPINGLVFHPNGQWLITYGDDKQMNIVDYKVKKLIIGATKLYGDEKAGIALFTLDNYYMVPASNVSGLHFTEDFNTYSFKQFDYRFNRPDKVLQALQSADTALIHSYKKAYDKRIKKLGIDTSLFTSNYSVPTADFANRNEVVFEQKTDKLVLKIQANDQNVVLDRFNVWINEVPVYGLKGINLKSANRNVVDTTITINLSAGSNKIETSVINTNGIESYRLPLIVNYTPITKPSSKLYFVGIGINKFEQEGHNLQWSVKDIRDLANKLKEKYTNQIEIDTLFDSQVLSENILALKTKLKQSNVNDKVIVAYSGHGLLSKNYDYFLSTFKIDFEKPEKNGLAYDSFEDLVDDIPARQKLMLIDACHSGEVDKEELQKINETEAKLATTGVQSSAEGTTNDETGKGGKVKNLSKGSKLGMKNSFELMQDLFANVGKGTGATIISAAGGMQYALEKNSLKNGVFTYSIIEYMNEARSSGIKKLKDRVNERVVELTSGMQQPTSRSENNVIDWNVW